MKLSFKIAFGVLTMLFWSCETLDESSFNEPPKVVVDGYIEEGAYPIVYLTYSSGYFEPVDSASLQELVLTTARVEVSDGEESEVLTLFRNTEVFPPFFYRATDLKGVAGKTYHLEVKSGDGVYSATTTIPVHVPIDSMWIENDPELEDLGKLWMRFQDDPDANNYYRNFIRVRNESEKFFPAYQSTIVDRVFNGELYDYPVLHLPESFLELDEDILFAKGDTIALKFCTIDRESFEYWRALEQELYLVGNPFGSSGNDIPSNVSGNLPVLGIWTGYGVTQKTILYK